MLRWNFFFGFKCVVVKESPAENIIILLKGYYMFSNLVCVLVKNIYYISVNILNMKKIIIITRKGWITHQLINIKNIFFVWGWIYVNSVYFFRFKRIPKKNIIFTYAHVFCYSTHIYVTYTPRFMRRWTRIWLTPVSSLSAFVCCKSIF